MKNNITDLQVMLLNYFRFNAGKSIGFQSIKAICVGLSEQFLGIEKGSSGRAPYQIFLPLVRWGLVEFVGNGRYQLAPSVLLNKANQHVVVNGHENLVTAFKAAFPHGDSDAFGVLRFESKDADQLARIAQEHKFRVSTPNVLAYLQNMRSVTAVADGWQLREVTERNGFQTFVENQGWQRLSIAPGLIVGNSNPGGMRYIIGEDLGFRLIPSTKDHPDAFNIAVSACRAIRQRSSGTAKSRTIQDEDSFFPIILDRLIAIHNFFDATGGMRSFCGSPSMAAQLIRILN
jgi:hypothetical protein